ncbi:MAG: VanZ family protein [Gammaproteobacteria bacterium]|nr:VanZ family protein [Gammaproteobacteria bacterium]
MKSPSVAVQQVAQPGPWLKLLWRLAFWIPLVISIAVAWTPNPAGLVASMAGSVAHIAAAGYLAFALSLAHFRQGPWPAVAAWMMVWGVTIELVQLFVDGRGAQIADLASDALGIAIGCTGYALWQRLTHRARDQADKPSRSPA